MREFLDKNDSYGEIKLWCSARKNNEVAVIVEANADEKLYGKFFSNNTGFFGKKGCEKVIELLNEVEKNKNNEKAKISGAIGIIDADFKRILNEKIETQNLFLTDGHDAEMMKVFSEAWKNVIYEHKNKDKLEKFENQKNITIKEHILNLSKAVACVRLLSEKEKLGLKFKTSLNGGKYKFLDYQKFIDEKRLSLDKDKMLKVIENKSEKPNFFKNNPQYLDEIKKIETENYDLKEFCNGHDFMNILSLALKKAINKINISSEQLEKDFTIAYRFDDFKETNLYHSLVEWENQNNDFKLLVH